MKTTRLLFFIAVALASTGCATSLAPGENFNDWTSPTASRFHQQEPRSAVAALAPHVDSEESRKE